MFRLIVVIFTLIFAATPTLACMSRGYLTTDQLSRADIIFIGTAIEYTPGRPAIITFKIKRIIKGPKLDQSIQVNWVNSTFGTPRGLDTFKKEYGETVRVGLIKQKTNLDKCRLVPVYSSGSKYRMTMHCEVEFYGESYKPVYHTPKGLSYIQNGGCTNPHIFSENANRTLPQYPRPAIVSNDELKRIVFDTIKQETISYIEKHKKWPRDDYTIKIEPKVKRFFKVIVTPNRTSETSHYIPSRREKVSIFLNFDYDKASIVGETSKH